MQGVKSEPQNREPHEYSRNNIGIYLPWSLYSQGLPSIFLGVPASGVPFYSLYTILRRSHFSVDHQVVAAEKKGCGFAVSGRVKPSE